MARLRAGIAYIPYTMPHTPNTINNTQLTENMETILKRLEKHGYDSNHPDYEVLVEILTTVKMLKETIEPFVSNDPVKHRVNLNIRGRLIQFLACQDDEYYLRKAAKLLNEKDA